MASIFAAVAVLGGLGAVFGIALALASQIFAVEEDPRLEPLTEALPGANCGACGFSGCAAYAAAVLDGTTVIGACPVGGTESAEAMQKLMGVALDTPIVRQVALVRCSGAGREHERYIYEGIHDCLAASRVTGGGAMSCPYGCLGFGTCAKVCQFDAIHVVGNAAVVDEEKCKGCLKCTAICPRAIITIIPYGSDVSVLCSSHKKGAQTRKDCKSGCIGCGLCVKVCPAGAITVDDNLAQIDYSKCIACTSCAEKCPQKLIRKSAHIAPPDAAV